MHQDKELEQALMVAPRLTAVQAEKMKAVIAEGAKGGFGWKVEFKDMQMIAVLEDPTLGIRNETVLGAELVVAALFAKLPQGRIAEIAQSFIVSGLKLFK